MIWDTEITEVKGESKLESVGLINKLTKEPSKLDVDGLFVAIGHNPSSALFKGLVDLDEKGYVVPKDGLKTNIEGVFVSGDIHDHVYKQAITAAGYGCMAGMEVVNYISELK